MTRFETIFVSIVALLMGCILLLFGGALLLSPFNDLPLRALSLFKVPPLFGGTILGFFGLSLIIAFYSLSKRRFLRFKTSGYSISEELLAELAETSLRTIYPNASCQVLVRQGKRLEVTANLHIRSFQKGRNELFLQSLKSYFVKQQKTIFAAGVNSRISASLGITEEELDQIERLLQETFAEACGFREPFRLNLIATV